MKKSILAIAIVVLALSYSNSVSALNCESPNVEYQGACVEPFPSCINPPANVMPSTCIDKIENGDRIFRYSFSCMTGYVRQGFECATEAVCESPKVMYQGECLEPLPACINPPVNVMPSTCIDKIENNDRIFRYSFSCISGYVRQGFECVKESAESACQSPNVEYQGKCVDPIPACITPIAHSTSCIDKIDNGRYIEHYSFSCLPGYRKTDNQCVGSSVTDKCQFPLVEYQGQCADPIPACINPPANVMPSTCIDKIENGDRTFRYSFSCKEGYIREGFECVTKADYKPALTSTTPVPTAGFEDEVIVNPETYQNPFPDTNNTYVEGKAATELYRRGVIGGYPDGEFKGVRTVNRAEAAKFLLLARYASVDELKNTGRFTDVVEGQWYVKFIVRAANLGIIEGYSDGNFRPQNTVNTAEFLKMLTLTFGLETGLDYRYTDVQTSDWFAKYAGSAMKFDLFPNRSTKLEPGRELTRDEVAVAIYQYLKNR